MNQTTAKFEMLLSPRRLFFRVLVVIFLAELVVHFLLFRVEKLVPGGLPQEFLDSTTLSLMLAPFLWWWIIRPLGSAAMRERMLAANVINTSVDAIITIDDRGRITAFNPAAESLFGYAKEEALGQNVKMLMPPAEREQHDAHLGRYLRTGEKRIIGLGREVIAQRKDGVTFPIYLSVSEAREGDRPIFTGIVHDLTDRKRAEEVLRLQSAALESAANAILITDKAGNISWVNPAFTQHTGYSFEEVRGKNPRLLKSGKQERAFYREMWETILAGKVWRNTVINRRKDGTLNHEDLTITPIRDATGTITHFVGIKQDITEKTHAQEALLASELRYRRLFESAKDGILILDATSGQIVDVNPFLIEVLGYSKEDLVGRELWELGVFKDIVASKAAFVELQQKEYIRYENLPLETRGGIVKQAEFVSNSYLVNGSRVIQCNIRDITERKQAEMELTATNQRLEQALAELQAKRDEVAGMTQQLWQASKLATMGELAASIAHELNNPLATVGLRAESLLMQLPEDSDKRKPLEIIAQEVDRMATLVNNLLQFSRRGHRQVSTVDPREEIANSVEFVHYHLRTRKIEVVRDFVDDLPTIQADRQQLRQLFLNLLTNASDAMPQGGKLTVRAAPSALADAEAVAIEFADTGEGITAENLEKLWEPFFTTKPEGKGTGLGLAICRRIVEDHGGTIDIQSQVGRGTTIRIVLPATAHGASS
jgi:nitrogen fixation negative regulator NifL